MSQSVDWLVFSAHPDDAEIGMGATLAKYAQNGVRIVLCDFTRAELSSNGDPISREKEAANAANVLGIAKRVNLGLPDRGLHGSHEQMLEVTKIIRTYQPRLIFAPYYIDRHPDHVKTAEMIRDAVLNARLRKYAPELPAWKIDRLWHYTIHQFIEPQWVVDVSDHYPIKKEALNCYESQFLFREGLDRVSTPINQAFLQQIEAKDRLMGSRIGKAFGEAFITAEAIELHF